MFVLTTIYSNLTFWNILFAEVLRFRKRVWSNASAIEPNRHFLLGSISSTQVKSLMVEYYCKIFCRKIELKFFTTQLTKKQADTGVVWDLSAARNFWGANRKRFFFIFHVTQTHPKLEGEASQLAKWVIETGPDDRPGRAVKLLPLEWWLHWLNRNFYWQHSAACMHVAKDTLNTPRGNKWSVNFFVITRPFPSG